jgi:hypothetical protein
MRFLQGFEKTCSYCGIKSVWQCGSQTLAAFFVLLAIYCKNVVLKIESAKTMCFLKISIVVRIQQKINFFVGFLYIVQVSSQK